MPDRHHNVFVPKNENAMLVVLRPSGIDGDVVMSNPNVEPVKILLQIERRTETAQAADGLRVLFDQVLEQFSFPAETGSC